MEHQERVRVTALAGVLAAVAISLASATNTPSTPGNAYRYGGGPVFRPPDGSEPCQVDAYFDMNGITGTISFYQERKDARPVEITVRLMGLDQFDGQQLGWHIHEWPINFGLLEFGPCSDEEVGGHYDPFDRAASDNYTQECAANLDDCEVGDLSGRHGPLNSSLSKFFFEDYHLDLYRAFGIMGRSIVLHTEDEERVACANLEYSDGSLVSTYRAVFPYDPLTQDNTLQGDIILKRIKGKAGMTLHAELYRVDPVLPAGNQSSFYNWTLRLGSPGEMGDCSDIRHIYGSKTHANDPIHINYNIKCTPSSQRRCYIGDLTSKCGLLESDDNGRIKHFCTDEQLGVIPLEDVLKLSVVINETNQPEFLACSKFVPVVPEVYTAYFRIDEMGLQGHLVFYQTDPHEPTYVRIHLVGLNGNGGGFQIRDKPCQVGVDGLCIDCENLGGVFEPRPDQQYIAPGEEGLTGDEALLGELKYKWDSFEGENEFRTTQRSSYTPLFGPFSIEGRSLVLNMINGEPLACANLERLYPVPPYLPSLLGFAKKK